MDTIKENQHIIKSNELRIGNWVNCIGFPKKIEGISIRLRPECGYYQLNDIPNEIKGMHLQPIPLTEEWLVKFRFYKDRHYYYITLLTGLTLFYSSEYKKFWFDVSGLDVPSEIKYIHQLQNLHFALTNTELIIEL